MLQRLQIKSFIGNVRELKSQVEFACTQAFEKKVITEDEFLLVPEFSPSLDQFVKLKNDQEEIVKSDINQISDLKVALQMYEKKIIESRLERCSGDILRASQTLKLPRRTLADKCMKYGIKSI